MGLTKLSLAEGLQPWAAPYAEWAVEWMEQATGVTPTITSVFRSIEKQQQLYDARAKNPYPVNRPGDSAHNWGMGWDSDVPDRYMATWVAIRRAVGWRVPDNDEVHAEVPGWRDFVRAAGYQLP